MAEPWMPAAAAADQVVSSDTHHPIARGDADPLAIHIVSSVSPCDEPEMSTSEPDGPVAVVLPPDLLPTGMLRYRQFPNRHRPARVIMCHGVNFVVLGTNLS